MEISKTDALRIIAQMQGEAAGRVKSLKQIIQTRKNLGLIVGEHAVVSLERQEQTAAALETVGLEDPAAEMVDTTLLQMGPGRMMFSAEALALVGQTLFDNFLT